MGRENTSLKIVFILILSAALMYSNGSSLSKAADSQPPLPAAGFWIGQKPFRFMGGFIPGWHFGDQSTNTDDNLMQTARNVGITVLFAMPPEFEKQLGVYNETELVKLDHFLDSAGRAGIYVMPSFIQAYYDTLQPDWPYYHPRSIEGLIKEPALRQAFKNRIAALVNRRNTINGRLYREDPTLMGWILCIEPVSGPMNYPNGLPQVSLEEMTDWFEENASYVKNLDPNHLVTVQIHPAFQSFFGYGEEFLKAVNIPQFDFIYSEDADLRIIRNAPDNDYSLILFKPGKPVVFSPAFTSGTWDQSAICYDYSAQAGFLDQATRAYFEAGSAGVLIQNWASQLEEIPSFDQCFSYTLSNLVMSQCFSTLSTWINPDGSPGMPLRFVKCTKQNAFPIVPIMNMLLLDN